MSVLVYTYASTGSVPPSPFLRIVSYMNVPAATQAFDRTQLRSMGPDCLRRPRVMYPTPNEHRI
jgi:hypothetical protein